MRGDVTFAVVCVVLVRIYFWIIAPAIAERCERRAVAQRELEQAQARFKAAIESAHQQMARQPWDTPNY